MRDCSYPAQTLEFDRGTNMGRLFDEHGGKMSFSHQLLLRGGAICLLWLAAPRLGTHAVEERAKRGLGDRKACVQPCRP